MGGWNTSSLEVVVQVDRDLQLLLEVAVVEQVLADLLGEPPSVWEGRFAPPAATIRHVGGCRLVVTGTFHTAVFALSQGIPAVGIARSPMYVDKFAALADQFGRGCRAIALTDANAMSELEAAVDDAWRQAPAWRPELLAAAERQIALGRAAYQRLYELVESRRRR